MLKLLGVALRWVVWLAWPLLPAAAAAQSTVLTEHVRARLVAHAPEGVAPGKPVWVGLLLEHRPEWHTYWKNPGDSGLPTTLAWQLPTGVAAGEIDWPAPKRLPIGPLVNYGYDGTVLLPVPLTVSSQFAGGAMEIGLRAEWLVCRERCIPEVGEFRLQLPADGSAVVRDAESFSRAFASRPVSLASVVARAKVQGAALAVEVDGLPEALRAKAIDLFAADAGVIDHAGTPVQHWQGDRLLLQVPLSAQRSDSPAAMEAVLTYAGTAVGIRFPVDGGWPPPGAEPAAPAAASSLALSLGLAFVGGLLLNLMPCVFPVLSLKVLGFARHADDRRLLAAGGVAYAAGVILSFVGLASLLLALRAAGTQLGWGFQLQSPWFVASLAVLFSLIGLNLLGVFEIRNLVPGRIAGVQLRHPVADHALTGVLAVAVASPCTAPFMGAAVGAALARPTPEAMAVFVALGAGMAAPYLLAALWPPAARLLPRPGAWMLRFKMLMAVPMFATVVWLLWVLAQQVGSGGEPAGTPRWRPWSTDAVARALAADRPVFVDFTAAWCVTCQYNKRTTLSDDALLAELDGKGVLFLRADWTKRDPAISRELTRLGRSGVPVYALYEPGTAHPRLLSEILSATELREATARWPIIQRAASP